MSPAAARTSWERAVRAPRPQTAANRPAAFVKTGQPGLYVFLTHLALLLLLAWPLWRYMARIY
jgi:hypothetical protein